MNTVPADRVRWFRDSSPYIHAHRGRTFVVSFGGEAVADGLFANLVHDFALLNSLGVRLVLVHGIRPQIEQRLQARGIEARYHRGLRITDAIALDCVKEAAGAVRVEIEALLSMGLANSPMAGACIRVASGNFVVARPRGVCDGVDFGQTGVVRRVDVEGVRGQLEQGNVVLLSPVGYSPTGEVFNLSAEEVATAVAIALDADKLLLLTEEECRAAADDKAFRQLTTDEADLLLTRSDSLAGDIAPHLRAAVMACRGGVKRAHLVDRHQDGAVLLELFTRDGVGVLVSTSPFEEMRLAQLGDIGGICDLIRPLEAAGVLVQRTRERLETEIDDYTVIERDGMVVGCAALHAYPEESAGELACVALHEDYRGEGRGDRLLDYIERRARERGLRRLFVLTTQTTHWFREHGFEPAGLDDLPSARRALYNHNRNSKILFKSLDRI
ncbi:amino-acid N-acetyltransferase [Methylococcus sp. EFPC2]|uniref:amino-acid N-acetyltransferase n=1 Tax=Methylococcus sp. EFPC2 TaxID=2812648 RepID=UPI001967E8C3|nr:amino-acid N-acetyltransferase [Methylococcus sp. EFPC2]QSA97975.1 amino-acid N-acetyltransferase [Methylococcus sp. EFPC2]